MWPARCVPHCSAGLQKDSSECLPKPLSSRFATGIPTFVTLPLHADRIDYIARCCHAPLWNGYAALAATRIVCVSCGRFGHLAWICATCDRRGLWISIFACASMDARFCAARNLISSSQITNLVCALTSEGKHRWMRFGLRISGACNASLCVPGAA